MLSSNNEVQKALKPWPPQPTTGSHRLRVRKLQVGMLSFLPTAIPDTLLRISTAILSSCDMKEDSWLLDSWTPESLHLSVFLYRIHCKQEPK